MQESFQAFCGEWREKLDRRERRNRSTAAPHEGTAGVVVVDYVGYEQPALRCEATPRPGPEAIGRLVYHELHLRQHGHTLARALATRPAILLKIEVTEIFRFDGQRWVY